MVLTQEAFVKEVIDSFKDIRKEIAKLCKQYNDLDKKIAVHLKVEEELDEYKKNELDKVTRKKDRRVYLVIALMGLGFAAYQIVEKAIFP